MSEPEYSTCLCCGEECYRPDERNQYAIVETLRTWKPAFDGADPYRTMCSLCFAGWLSLVVVPPAAR